MAKETIYANTCAEKESGDSAGYVVIIADGTPLPTVSLSWSEGAMMDPVRVVVTEYDRKSGNLAFRARIESGEFHFTGRLGSHILDGRLSDPFSGSSRPVKLEERARRAAFVPDSECR